MKKVVLKVGVHDNKAKKKALKLVSSLEGVDTIAMDMKEKKLTVTGDVDPVDVVKQLRKSFEADILTVGPVKESDKKEKVSDPCSKLTECAQMDMICRDYHNYSYLRYPVCRIDDNPNSCTIS